MHIPLFIRNYFFTASILLLSGMATASSSKSSCIVRRAAFDMGSASTKMKVADIDICLQKLVKEIDVPTADEDLRVDYSDDVSKSLDKKFSPHIQQEGLKALIHLKQVATKLGAKSFAASATGGFREALNAKEVAALLSHKTKINIVIIPQKQEARLGYAGALGKITAARANPVIWDVGGATTEMISRDENGAFISMESQFATRPFKQQIIQKLVPPSDLPRSSPNPLSEDIFMKAVALAKEWAQKEIPASVANALVRENHVIYGIGPVFNKSLHKWMSGKDIVHPDDILAAFKVHAQKATIAGTLLTDAFLHTLFPDDQYLDTLVSNAAFIQGYLLGMGITELRTLKVNLTDGVLVDSTFYPHEKKATRQGVLKN